MPELDLKNIITEGRKEVPQGTLLRVSLGSRPGTVTVHVQLPDQTDWTMYSDLQIVNGTVTLPVKLVFLSHAKEDARFIRDLAHRLLQDGVLAWFDEKELLPGDDWKRKIDEAIESSDFVLVFLSATSVSKTGYFQRELKYALDQHQLRPEGSRYIIPIIIDECQPPRSLRDIHWLRTDTSEWYERLKRALLS
ncbi:protein of unknown function [Nitrospira defluvii]|jgi:hypothetical protein|uniref:TIR domain-containing protein n=1 Tax=Nitrospira defluvii TaxID=330214 RepID=D8PA10_9BACT|nr:protein of unknown function [Nitrospira defluvii]